MKSIGRMGLLICLFGLLNSTVWATGSGTNDGSSPWVTRNTSNAARTSYTATRPNSNYRGDVQQNSRPTTAVSGITNNDRYKYGYSRSAMPPNGSVRPNNSQNGISPDEQRAIKAGYGKNSRVGYSSTGIQR